jgi:hypothetical protein
MHTGFWWGKLRERDHLEDPIDWIDLAQDRERWRTLVNAAMNFGVP